MAIYYLDTSALVKLYVREAGSDVMVALASRSAGHQLTILSLAQIELRSAIRRRERNGDLPTLVAADLLSMFQIHLETKFTCQPVTDFLLDTAASLVDRHTLRAFDAIQLAGYVVMRLATGDQVPFFVCADRELLAAAEGEGAPLLDLCS
ncbi:MAG TPA: type II toxin-antitoxin system VapC family toxin [Bryocella sp.]|nr:type II toxin-antitoxin system VapC family toxin [Bryocella sp.]